MPEKYRKVDKVDFEKVTWPESMWPLVPADLKSYVPELLPSIEELNELKYPWELLSLLRSVVEQRIDEPRIGENVTIPDTARIRGDVWIGDNVLIYDNASIYGPSYIGSDTVVGNNSVIRQSVVGSQCLVGANSELARSIVGSDCEFHVSFFLDSYAGNSDKFPAFKTANYRIRDHQPIKSYVNDKKIDTGLTKLGTIVGPDTVFTAGCITMPGILVGRNCYIYTGINLLDNVPDNSVVRKKKDYEINPRR
jgi:UDP-N-acetylglucosamine diphosphorylase / glucose-1-phosphate thymidylyltransferase / UDP-N-acetylgalactosamine diphosphorylase / glucosamine-1-phosphate N-acetyltransferase / galactosamine-1-phosphate N-acetyltransferase